MSKNKHLGSDFDDFLQAEGLLVDASEVKNTQNGVGALYFTKIRCYN